MLPCGLPLLQGLLIITVTATSLWSYQSLLYGLNTHVQSTWLAMSGPESHDCPNLINFSYRAFGLSLLLITVSAQTSCGLSPDDITTYSCCLVELALTILKKDLYIQDEYHSVLALAPTMSFRFDAIGHECAWCAFWYIRLMHLTAFSFFQYQHPLFPWT